MIYLKRILFLLGEAAMITGALWTFSTRYNRGIFLPEGWNRPDLAIMLAIGGFIVFIAAGLAGGDVHGIFDRYRRRHSVNKPKSAAYDDMTPEQQKAFRRKWLQESLARDNAEQRAEMQEAWERPQTRARLAVAIPQTPTQSWIGGNPHLPVGMPWPEIEGEPGCFVAQIALADLPQSTFRGLGPRDGWLVFFCGAENDVDTVVLHVTGNVTEHTPPEGSLGHRLWTEAEEQLKPLIENAINTRPRWFLHVADPDTDRTGQLDEEEEQMAGYQPSLFDQFQQDYTPTNVAFQPFDWPSALLLLTQVRDFMTSIAGKDQFYDEGPNGLERNKLGITFDQHRSLFLMIIEEFETLAQTAPYDETIHRSLIETLTKLTNKDWSPPNGKTRSYLDFPRHPRLNSWAYEAYARRAYTNDPSSLPDRTRTVFEPIWREQSDKESIYVGTKDEGSVYTQSYDRLIDLPTSHLTGQHFGDMSRWWVETPPLDFMRGRFDRASGNNSHGGY